MKRGRRGGTTSGGERTMEPADSKHGRILSKVDMITLIVVVILVLALSALLLVILF
jgi:hypothetical protein